MQDGRAITFFEHITLTNVTYFLLTSFQDPKISDASGGPASQSRAPDMSLLLLAGNLKAGVGDVLQWHNAHTKGEDKVRPRTGHEGPEGE